MNESRPTLAFFSPLPPVRSGVADYSQDLLLSLRSFYDIDIFVDQGQPSSPEISANFSIYDHQAFPGRHRQRRYGGVIYQLGNNACHAYMLDYLRRYPGIVVLHDFNLHGLVWEATAGRGRMLSYLGSLLTQAGWPGWLAAAGFVRCWLEYKVLGWAEKSSLSCSGSLGQGWNQLEWGTTKKFFIRKFRWTRQRAEFAISDPGLQSIFFWASSCDRVRAGLWSGGRQLADFEVDDLPRKYSFAVPAGSGLKDFVLVVERTWQPANDYRQIGLAVSELGWTSRGRPKKINLGHLSLADVYFKKVDTGALPLNRSVLASARGVIVHSRLLEGKIKSLFPQLPVRQIDHGVRLLPPEPVQVEAVRQRSGWGPERFVLGAYGSLQKSKKIQTIVEVFERFLGICPEAVLILAGEPVPEPDFDLPVLLARPALSGKVLVTGYLPLSELYQYMAACDVAFNLRQPSAMGETSGILLRLFSLAKPVLISDFGQYSEYPDEICLKVKPGPDEKFRIGQILERLWLQPELRQAIGRRARQAAAGSHTWENAARQYHDFLESVIS